MTSPDENRSPNVGYTYLLETSPRKRENRGELHRPRRSARAQISLLRRTDCRSPATSRDWYRGTQVLNRGRGQEFHILQVCHKANPRYSPSPHCTWRLTGIFKPVLSPLKVLKGATLPFEEGPYSVTEFEPLFAMYTSPLASIATPSGKLRPVPSPAMMRVGEVSTEVSAAKNCAGAQTEACLANDTPASISVILREVEFDVPISYCARRCVFYQRMVANDCAR